VESPLLRRLPDRGSWVGIRLPQRPSLEVLGGTDGYLVTVSEKLRLTITYEEPDEDGWIVARVLEVPGALSQGKTPQEARENAIDALRLMLAPDDDDSDVAAGRSEQLDVILSG
jgi:predicted RNase H-like HicB family nuclease